MRIENSIMLSLFAQDPILHYPKCVDISMAGEDYKVSKIVFFAKDEKDPLSDYVQIKHYDDDFLLIYAYTQDPKTISEAMAYVKSVRNDFRELELRTPFASALEMTDVNADYRLETPDDPVSPIYYIYHQKDLSKRKRNASVAVSLLTNADLDEIALDGKEGRLDPEAMNADSFRSCSLYRDVKVYVVRAEGQIAGYLRAECGFENIYDIGWLYVEPRFRGRGLAVDLVLYFSNDAFARGAVPHYGYAVSAESARVAEKCGYTCDPTPLYCKTLILNR